MPMLLVKCMNKNLILLGYKFCEKSLFFMRMHRSSENSMIDSRHGLEQAQAEQLSQEKSSEIGVCDPVCLQQLALEPRWAWRNYNLDLLAY